jgi:hypothetical protein
MFWSATAPAWCGFFANMKDGRVLCRHELNWFGEVPEQAAQDIKDAMKRWDITRFTGVVANPELWPKKKQAGQTVSETFSRFGIAIRKGNDDRINGWSRVRSWMLVKEWPGDDGEKFASPSLIIHPECAQLVRTFPTLIASATHPDDVSPCIEEYPASGVRFYAMSRPAPTPHPILELPEGAIGRELQSLREELAASV